MSVRSCSVIAMCLLAAACSTTSPSPSPNPRTTAPIAKSAAATHASSGSPIAVLQTRDRRIELHSRTRVTIRNNEGDLVAEDLTLSELEERDPFLYDVCRASFANNDGAFLDARLDRPQPKLMGIVGD